MGKPEDELYLPTAVSVGGAESSSNPGGEGRCGCRLLGLKCLVVLLLGVAVFLSAAFWLPPLSKLSDPEDSDLDPRFRGHGIVASFKLKKSVIFLQENEDQLESDIFDELQVPYTKVVILSLDGSPGSNETDVVFAVDPQRKHTQMPAAAKSLIRSSFVLLVTGQSNLTLTTSLFEDPDNFEVLKFSGGITVAPYQNAFLLQQTQVKFNFTLNFSIRQVIENLGELKSQLRSGLRLAYYEILYVSMINLRGSTISSPVTIQSSVLLAVGIHPSTHRLKQLAQTITGSPSKNLGLNNTVFGKVKQVSLSSTLQHSLNDGASGSSAHAPAPTPLVHPHQHHHHHHHHHHGHHHHQYYDHDTIPSPSIAPSSVPVKIPPPMPLKGLPHAPAPITGYHHAGPGCRYGFRRSHGKNISKQYTPAPAPAPSISPLHASMPHSPVVPPPPAAYREPSSSPLPHVVLEHRHSPSRREPDSEPPDEMPSKAFFPSKSDAGLTAITPWLFCLLIAAVLQLLAA